MTSRPPTRQRRLAAAFAVGLAVSVLLGVLLNLAQAITGDQGWPSRQPWSGVRVGAAALLLVCAVGLLAVRVVGRTTHRRPRP